MARHWNFPGCEERLLRIETPTNCETVELLLEGKSLGVRRAADYPNRTILWYVPYAPGALRAVGRNGAAVAAEDEIRTAGEAAALELRVDHPALAADGQDAACVEVEIVDEAGVVVPTADRPVTFAVSGAGRLLGTDNGDLRGPEPYAGPVRTTRGGRCLAVVQAGREAGVITVTATAAGLPPVTVPVTVG